MPPSSGSTECFELRPSSSRIYGPRPKSWAESARHPLTGLTGLGHGRPAPSTPVLPNAGAGPGCRVSSLGTTAESVGAGMRPVLCGIKCTPHTQTHPVPMEKGRRRRPVGRVLPACWPWRTAPYAGQGPGAPESVSVTVCFEARGREARGRAKSNSKHAPAAGC